MTFEELKKELSEVWIGSGYSVKSLLRTMDKFNFAKDKPFEESYPAIYNCSLSDQKVVVVVSLSGYKFLKEID